MPLHEIRHEAAVEEGQDTAMIEPSPELCELYKPGHRVHHIQARKSAVHGKGRPGTLREVRVDGRVRVVFGDEVREFRVHDPRNLQRAADGSGAQVFLRERWSLLVVPRREGWRLFSICEPSEWAPCQAQGPRSDLAPVLQRPDQCADRGSGLGEGDDVAETSHGGA